MFEITQLGSGSRGNATLIRSSKTAIMVDAGFTCRQLTLRLTEAGWSPEMLDGILVSHEHNDHVCGLRVLNKKHQQKVFATAATLKTKPLEEANLDKQEEVVPGDKFTIGDVEITPFSIPHDAADPVGFILESEGIRFAHLTDIGFPTELAKHHLSDCHGMLLESNHDRDMLINGSYPWPVKQRIMGRMGHLNNEHAAELLSCVVHDDLQMVILGHLSQENNSAQTALHTSKQALLEKGITNLPGLVIAKQSTPIESVRLG